MEKLHFGYWSIERDRAKPQNLCQNMRAWLITDRFQLVSWTGSKRRIHKILQSVHLSQQFSIEAMQTMQTLKVLFGTFALLVDIVRILENQLDQHVQGIHGRWKRVELSRPTRAIHRMTHKVGSPLAFCRLEFLKSEPESWRELSARIFASWLNDVDYVILYEG